MATLSLRLTQTTDIGLNELGAIPKLTSLNISATKVSNAGVPELVKLTNVAMLDLDFRQ